jgi:hypothetical protein
MIELLQRPAAKATADVIVAIPMAVQNPGGGIGGALQQAASGKASWYLNNSAFGATDSNGIVRVEEGNLGANGISAAGWKFRANDSSGNPIFDSDGLIGVSTLLGEASRSWSIRNLTGASGSSGISGNGGEVTLQTVTFALSRQASVLVLGATSGNIAVNAALGSWFFSGPMYIKVDTTNGPASGLPAVKTNAALFPVEGGVSVFQNIVLAAGGHTAKLVWNSQNGTNDTYNEYGDHLAVYVLGG